MITSSASADQVNSIEETLAAAIAAGGTIIMGKDPITETSWWAIIQDPDGNLVGLYEGTT